MRADVYASGSCRCCITTCWWHIILVCSDTEVLARLICDNVEFCGVVLFSQQHILLIVSLLVLLHVHLDLYSSGNSGIAGSGVDGLQFE